MNAMSDNPFYYGGIDITHVAITLIKKRLPDSFGEAIDRSRATVGEPAALRGKGRGKGFRNPLACFQAG